MLYRLMKALAIRGWSGQQCRRCGQEIVGDPFGASEAVCAPCRA
jgi:hypothetical protein